MEDAHLESLFVETEGGGARFFGEPKENILANGDFGVDSRDIRGAGDSPTPPDGSTLTYERVGCRER